MSNILFKAGLTSMLSGGINWASDTLKATMLTMAVAAGKIYPVTAASNASPIVLTVSSTTGIAAGDILVVGGIVGNLAANGTWQAGTVTGTTVQLLTKLDTGNSTGSGAYTSGGWILDVTSAAALADISGNSNGTDPTVTGGSVTNGVATSSAFTWTGAGVTATKVWGFTLYDSTASKLIAWYDGTQQIYVTTQASASATSIAVQRLPSGIATGTTIVFSNGASATLSGAAAAGDTTLTVSALAAIVTAKATADVPSLNASSQTSAFPFTPGVGGGLTVTPDTSVNKLFAI